MKSFITASKERMHEKMFIVCMDRGWEGEGDRGPGSSLVNHKWLDVSFGILITDPP